MIIRNRTPSEYVCYGLYLYFSGLSFRRASERLSCFIKRNYFVKIWNWIQTYRPLDGFDSKEREFQNLSLMRHYLKLVQNSSGYEIAIESENKQILALFFSKERNMFVAERFISGLINSNGKHPVSTDGWYVVSYGM